MDLVRAGNANLGRFLAATAGRRGRVLETADGIAVSSPFAVLHAYVNGAVPFCGDESALDFIDETVSFFRSIERPFKLWVPGGSQLLLDKAAGLGGVDDETEPRAMVLRSAIAETGSKLVVRRAISRNDFDIFGRVAEAGYGAPGLAWLQQEQGVYEDERIVWAIVYDEDEPIGTACGFLDSDTTQPTGGIYFVATPPEYRGRGAAAEVTRWVSNYLIESGASLVVLQSSEMGYGVYQRLGFETYDLYRRVSIAVDAAPN